MGYVMVISSLLPAQVVRRFARDRRGVAAIEFALIAPIALAAMLGAIEYSRAVIMARNFHLVTAMASDLIAREDSMDPAKMSGIENAIRTVWGTNPLATLQLQVVAVRAASTTPGPRNRPAGQTYVYWHYPLLTSVSPYVDGALYPLPNNMLAPGASTIIVNASYTYRTLFNAGVPGMVGTTMAWSSTSSHAPRNLCVGFPTANCTTTLE
jgi:Flp pilus assembly protein TadG